MQKARFRLRAVSIVRLAEACLKKLDRSIHGEFYKANSVVSAANEVLAESTTLSDHTFQTRHSTFYDYRQKTIISIYPRF